MEQKISYQHEIPLSGLSLNANIISQHVENLINTLPSDKNIEKITIIIDTKQEVKYE